MKMGNLSLLVRYLIISLLLMPGLGFAGHGYDRMVIFGDSLSDPGNAFYLTGVALKPPYETLDEFLIPDAPYRRGGYHFSDGKTWVERLAKRLGLAESAGPAFKGENWDKLRMTNYAVGGARAREHGKYVDLSTQMAAFFADTEGVISSQSLYVVALGGNDVRDAVAALAKDSTGLLSAEIIANALSVISDSVISLYIAGARTLIVANVPDVSVTPAIQKLDSVSPGAAMGAAILSAKFNAELAGLLATLEESSPGLQIINMDLYENTRELISNPVAYGLENVEEACVMPNQEPAICNKPRGYFFWDGIHPTKKVHQIFSNKAYRLLEDLSRDSDVICSPRRKDEDPACQAVLWL
jgi:outer membrane lipase/esterase